MKICFKCKIEKSDTDFYKNKARRDGLQTICKNCTKEYNPYWMAKKQYAHSPKDKACDKRGRSKYKKTTKGKISNQKQNRLRRELAYGLDMMLTNEDIKEIYIKFNNQCFNCGRLEKLEIDHHFPLSRGYGLSIKNAVLLCRFCNSSKHNRMPEEFYTNEQLTILKKIHDSFAR